MATANSPHDPGTDSWTGVFDSRLGPVAVALRASPGGLTAVNLLVEVPSSGLSTGDPEHPHLRAAVEQLRAYFAGTPCRFTVPLAPAGTPFQRRVWDAAAQIPHGQTRSYWWVAVRMGDPFAARAVGGALGANPVPILVPCHRVLRKDGHLGGFSAGLAWKRMLLDLEGAAPAGP